MVAPSTWLVHHRDDLYPEPNRLRPERLAEARRLRQPLIDACIGGQTPEETRMGRVRVAVTGIGVVSALGPDLRSFADGLLEGRSGLGELTAFENVGVRGRFVGQAPELVVHASWAGVATSRSDRFGIVAARAALAQAGLDARALAGAAVLFGCGAGGAAFVEDYLAAVTMTAQPSMKWLPAQQPASVTDLVARLFDLRGPRQTIMTGCSSSALAIGAAVDLLRLGEVDVALAGGVECLCRLTTIGFGALRAISSTRCRPFDAARNGLNLGEGGAVLVLESWGHAQARGARVIAELAGWGAACDAWHATAPHPNGDGAARAMNAALADASLPAEAIDHVNAHGTATVHNDVAEARAITAVFGRHTRNVAVSSIKPMIGHTLGASGALEAVAAILSLTGGFVPATLNTRTVDPTLPIDVVIGGARKRAVGAVMSNSFAFGGNNAALVFVQP